MLSANVLESWLVPSPQTLARPRTWHRYPVCDRHQLASWWLDYHVFLLSDVVVHEQRQSILTLQRWPALDRARSLIHVCQKPAADKLLLFNCGVWINCFDVLAGNINPEVINLYAWEEMYLWQKLTCLSTVSG